MEFTDRELSILSDGIIRLMEGAHKAKALVVAPVVQEKIDLYTAALRALNTKICNYMEG